MSSTYGRKQKAAAMAACRWGNLEKVTVQDFEYQVVIENRNLKNAETQTEISIALSSQTLVPRPFWPLRKSLTSFAIKLCDPVNLCPWTVLPNLRNSTVNCPSEPEKLHCLDITQINEAIEATNFQPLSQDSIEQQTVTKEARKLSLKAALFQEFHTYMKNANHSIEKTLLIMVSSKLVMDNFSLQHQPCLRT